MTDFNQDEMQTIAAAVNTVWERCRENAARIKAKGANTQQERETLRNIEIRAEQLEALAEKCADLVSCCPRVRA